MFAAYPWIGDPGAGIFRRRSRQALGGYTSSMIGKQIKFAARDSGRKMGRLGKGGGKVFGRPVDFSKCARCAQLVSAPLLMSEMAANRVGKVSYF